jgi:hypothetical protein
MQVSLRHHFSGVTFVSFVSNKLRYNGEKNAMVSPSDLFLRSSVIGGETREGDYQIIWDDIPIGRVYSTHGVGGHEIWNWGVILPNVPQLPEHRGSSSDLESQPGKPTPIYRMLGIGSVFGRLLTSWCGRVLDGFEGTPKLHDAAGGFHRSAWGRISCGESVFLVRATHDDLQDIVGQRPLQRLGFIPLRSQPDVALFIGSQDYRHRLGWMGATAAFGAVVRKP